MTLRSDSRLERILHDHGFAVTAEVVPPKGANAGIVREQAEALLGYADAVNITDNPTSSAHMSSVAGAALVAESGLEPVVQITTRDRNRLAITADLLGAWALGARNVLCLSGDPMHVGDDPEARTVNDLSVLEIVAGGVIAPTRAEIADPPRYTIGVAEMPLADPYDPAFLDRKLDAGADLVFTQI